MSTHHTDDRVTLLHGDCLDELASLNDSSIDAVVTDPPYGLSNTSPRQVTETIEKWIDGQRDYLPGGKGFMGKAWDAFVPPVAVWDECLRVLKPGGHLVAFAGSRTFDLMTLGVRLAGFEIRDSLAWLYGSGFPKSMDVAKELDKGAGHWRGRAGVVASGNGSMSGVNYERWQGWGTALKPAFEPIVLARKPLAGTVAGNVLAHGTGALNIDACRIGMSDTDREKFQRGAAAWVGHHERIGESRPDGSTRKSADVHGTYGIAASTTAHDSGRFPANVILDESQAAELDKQSGASRSTIGAPRSGASGEGWGMTSTGAEYADEGGASRFFYTAKASTDERPEVGGVKHPTVKPLDLMRWLVRLITPPGGVLLEPFAGSGTTVEACLIEGFRCVAIEREADYLPLILSRIHRRRDPVAALKLTGADLGLFAEDAS